MSIKVLHVAEVLKGGTSSYIQEVLDYQSTTFTPGNVSVIGPKSQMHFLNKSEVVSFSPYSDTTSRLKNIVALGAHSLDVLKKSNVDIVHIHGTFAGVAVRLALLFKPNKPKIIYCSHGWAFDRVSSSWKNKLIGWVERGLSILCDKIICISQHDYYSAIAHGISPRKLQIIKNGIADNNPTKSNQGHSISWPENKFKFLFIGRFDTQKGVDLFFEAMRKLGDSAYAIVIGDQSVGDALIPTPPQNIHLTGWLPREVIPAYLDSCDVFVMPSRWEGFGLSALEAMRASKPVIASNVGGLPELIENGMNGYLVKPNDVDALFFAMTKIMVDDVVKMGLASRTRYETFFTSNHLNTSIVDAYYQVLNKK